MTLSKIYASAFVAIALFLLPAPALSVQSYPPAWSSTSTYSVGDQVQVEGNVYRAIAAVNPPGPRPTKAYKYWELYNVRGNTSLVIGVGQDFPDLVTAWNYALNARIAGSAELTLFISTAKGNFKEQFPSFFSLDHPFGSHISIYADTAANTSLLFSSSGFYLDSGHAFGSLGNMQMTDTAATADRGIDLTGNASISDLFAMDINDFYIGVYAERGSQINCYNFNRFTDEIFLFDALTNGVIYIYPGFEFGSDTNESNPTTEVAFLASTGGQIFAQGSRVFNCSSYIAYAISGGVVNVDASTFGYSPIGVEAQKGGRIVAADCTFSSITTDLFADQGGTIDAAGSTFSTHFLGTGDGSYVWT